MVKQKIVVADYEQMAADNYIDLIKFRFPDKYDIESNWVYHGDRLVDLAKSGTVDIFILNLNCITNSAENLNLNQRLEYSQGIISQMKKENPTSQIIAHSSWGKQAEAAIKSGADFYFVDPAKVEGFNELIKKCLYRLHKVKNSG